MRRFTGLFVLIAILLSLASAQAQQTYSQPAYFSTTGQSMWKPGQAAGYSYNFGLTQSWDYHGESHHWDHVKVLGTFGFAASLDTTGMAGFNFNAYANSGDVAVNYPITLNLSYPDPSGLSPGQTFTVRSTWSIDESSAQMRTHSPDAGVKLNVVLKSRPLKAELKARLFSHTVFDFPLIDNPIDYEKTLLDSHNLLQGSYDLIPNILTVDYHQPHVATSGGGIGFGLPVLHSTGQDSFLKVTGDFSNALAQAVGLPSNTFNGSYGQDYSFASASVSWAFLDLQGIVPISLAQDFHFTGTPTVTLNLSSGAPVTFQAGKSVQLTMPADGSPLTITPSVTLDNNEFSNRTNVRVGAVLQFNPLDLAFRIHVDDFWTHHFHFHPLTTFFIGTVPLDVIVYQQAFPLGGFSTQTLPAFTMTHIDNTPLAANDDYYTATSSDGVYYTLDVPAPGLLTNDTGPSGFHVNDYVGTTDDGLFAITIDTNGHFNFQGTMGAAGQYMIPYTITDGHGNYTTANIYVTVGGGG